MGLQAHEIEKDVPAAKLVRRQQSHPAFARLVPLTLGFQHVLEQRPIVALLLAFLATGVTIFASKVYKERLSGRVLVDWK